METFSPTVGFAAIRSMVAVLCDPKYAVDSYDLSGAFLGTTLEDQALYVRLPHDAGDYAHRVIRLTKAVYGVKNSGKLFMKQLGEAIMAFEERVDVQTAGVEGHKGRSVDVSRFGIDTLRCENQGKVYLSIEEQQAQVVDQNFGLTSSHLHE